jgi:hypothetical protein
MVSDPRESTPTARAPKLGCVFAIAALHLSLTVCVLLSGIAGSINAATRPGAFADTASSEALYWCLNPLVSLFLLVSSRATVPNDVLYLLLTLGSSITYGLAIGWIVQLFVLRSSEKK